MLLPNLNCWHTLFLFDKFNYFIEVRAALMFLLIPEASSINIIDFTVLVAMLLKLFYVLLCPFKVFLEFILSVLRHKIDWHSLKKVDY